MATGEGPGSGSTLTFAHGDPVGAELATAIHTGDLATLRRVLGQRPALARARFIGRHGPAGGWRTPLHLATDWPGYFPAAPEAVSLLLAAGADPEDDTGGPRPETPLHWAASTDDVAVAVVLVDHGVRLDTPGGSIGTPLDNAVGYGSWDVARLLVERGAAVDRLWHAAALGMLDRLEQLLAAEPTPEEISQAFWHACAGAQRRAAERLLECGADLDFSPDYAQGTALDAAGGAGPRRDGVREWLRFLGARSADGRPQARSPTAEVREQVRLAVYDAFRRTGRAPSPPELGASVGADVSEVREALTALTASRDLVFDDDAIVMAHPFSAVPLGFAVMGTEQLWWGGCCWDAFALAHLLDEQPRVLVATSCPACERPLAWWVDRDRAPAGAEVAHFLTPVARIWDDVVHSCAHQRLFCSEACVERWLARTGHRRGYVMDLATLWRLASGWYAGRTERGYHRREPADAAGYFRSVGLRGPFWGLPD